jgi:hypothetical protein
MICNHCLNLNLQPMRPHRPPVLPLLLIVAALGVTACSKSTDDREPETEQAATEEQAKVAEAAEQAEPTLPKVDYWQPIAGALQGRFGGKCTEGLQMKPVATEVKVGSNGAVTIGTFSANLHEGKATLLRMPPGKQAEGVSLIGEVGELFLTLQNSGPGNTDNVIAKYGDKDISCSGIKDVLPLDGKTLFTTYAQQFTVKPRKVTCVGAGQDIMSRRKVDFQLEGNLLRVGTQTFDLNKVTTEQVMLSESGAAYAVGTEPQRLANVSFDEYGRLKNVTVNGFDQGESYACDSDLEQAAN